MIIIYNISQNNYSYEKTLCIISAWNDKIMRYLDIKKVFLKNNNLLMKSYIIYVTNNLVPFHFTKSSFDKTNRRKSSNFISITHKKWSLSILNENWNAKTDIANIPGFSE